MGINIKLTLDNDYKMDIESLRVYLLLKHRVHIEHEHAVIILKILYGANLNNSVVSDELLIDLLYLTNLDISSNETKQSPSPKARKSNQGSKSVASSDCVQLQFGSETEEDEIPKNINDGAYRIKPKDNKDVIGKESQSKRCPNKEKDNSIAQLLLAI